MGLSNVQVKAIEHHHANLASRMASSYTEIVGEEVTVVFMFSDQTTFGEFVASLPELVYTYTFTVKGLDGPALIDYSLEAVHLLISSEVKMGLDEIRADVLGPEHRDILNLRYTKTMDDLQETWKSKLEIEVADAMLETSPSLLELVDPEEETVLLVFEVESPSTSGLVRLCYPVSTIEPALAHLMQ